jgi:hypothetical protein
MPRNSKYYSNSINNNNTSLNYDRKRDVSPPNDSRYAPRQGGYDSYQDEYRSVSPVLKATFRDLQGESPSDWELPPGKM